MVQDKVGQRFEQVLNNRFKEIGDEIKARKFYEDIGNLVEGFGKPLDQNESPAMADPS